MSSDNTKNSMLEVRENPDLMSFEKETVIILNSETALETGMISVHSDQAPVIRYLLNLSDAEIKHREIKIIDGNKYIVGVIADIPIGHFKLRNRKRNSDYIYECVS